MKPHHIVIYDDAHGHPGVDRCERCRSNSIRKDWGDVCEGAKAQWWRSGWARKYRKVGVIQGLIHARLVTADKRWTIAHHTLHNQYKNP